MQPSAADSGDTSIADTNPHAQQIQTRILGTLSAEGYTPQRPRQIARVLEIMEGRHYDSFRDALRELMDEGRVVLGSGGAILLPSSRLSNNELVGTYRHNQQGFGFVVPTDADSHEDLFIPPGDQNGALTGDVVRCRIIPSGRRQGKQMYEGQILEILQRANTKFAGTMSKVDGKWYVFPDGKSFTDPIYTPDAGSRYVTPGQKVVVEVTKFPGDEDSEDHSDQPHAMLEGVIVQVLGDPSEKDVDLWSVVTQFGLAGKFPDEVQQAASDAVKNFDARDEIPKRLDMTKEIICTIDPDDAKDYDDAISLTKEQDASGKTLWKLGVHIADVSHFVKPDTPLDEEAYSRGNSTYFPGHVIPMLPEVLSNGVC
ncbi:MAG: RNB domain-containing ribonuclease, partial [Planctomycetota bacterium]